MTTDAIVFAACCVIGVFALGLEIGKDNKPLLCPVVPGQQIVSTIAPDVCVYARRQGSAQGKGGEIVNMWLESIANIQRKRPPPQDVDLETKLIGPLYACNKCGEEKTEAGYYVRTNHSTGTSRRSTVCKACELAKERDERARTAKPKPMTTEEMVIGALSMKPMTVSELADAIGRHRRAVDTALDKLILNGIIEQRGYVIKKYHPRVMTYQLTQARPGAGERNAA